MWSLETLAQLNAKHAELGEDNKPVDARQVYSECGIRTLGSTRHRSPQQWCSTQWTVTIVKPLVPADPTVYLFGPVIPLVTQDQIDRQVLSSDGMTLPMSPEGRREINDAIFERLADPAVNQAAVDLVCEYTRAKMGLPPLPKPE